MQQGHTPGLAVADVALPLAVRVSDPLADEDSDQEGVGVGVRLGDCRSVALEEGVHVADGLLLLLADLLQLPLGDTDAVPVRVAASVGLPVAVPDREGERLGDSDVLRDGLVPAHCHTPSWRTRWHTERYHPCMPYWSMG